MINARRYRCYICKLNLVRQSSSHISVSSSRLLGGGSRIPYCSYHSCQYLTTLETCSKRCMIFYLSCSGCCWLSECDDFVAINHPLSQFWHGGLFCPVEIRMVLIDSATSNAGSACFDGNAFGYEILQHRREILVIVLGWFADISCHVYGIIHQKNSHFLSGFLKFVRQAKTVPCDISVVVWLVVEDDQYAHVFSSLLFNKQLLCLFVK